MKLHLPKGLRTAVLACFAAFAGIGTTISTATITGGVFAVSMASVAQAGVTVSAADDATSVTTADGTTTVTAGGTVNISADSGGSVTIAAEGGGTVNVGSLSLSALKSAGNDITLEAAEDTTVVTSALYNMDGDGSWSSESDSMLSNLTLTGDVTVKIVDGGFSLKSADVTINAGATLYTGALMAWQSGETGNFANIRVNGGTLSLDNPDDNNGRYGLFSYGSADAGGLNVDVINGGRLLATSTIGYGNDIGVGSTHAGGQAYDGDATLRLSIGNSSSAGLVVARSIRFSNSTTSTVVMGNAGSLLILRDGFKQNEAGDSQVYLNAGTLAGYIGSDGVTDRWVSAADIMVGDVVIHTSAFDNATGEWQAGTTGLTMTLNAEVTGIAGTQLTVDGAGTLAIGGTLALTDAIKMGANASLTLLEGAKIDVANLATDGNSWTLLTADDLTQANLNLGTLSGVEILNSGVEVDEDPLLVWTLEGGKLSWAVASDLSYAGGTMDWGVGSMFTGGAFSQGSKVTFTGTDESRLTLTENITSDAIVVSSGATVTLLGADYTLEVSDTLENAGSLTSAVAINTAHATNAGTLVLGGTSSVAGTLANSGSLVVNGTAEVGTYVREDGSTLTVAAGQSFTIGSETGYTATTANGYNLMNLFSASTGEGTVTICGTVGVDGLGWGNSSEQSFDVAGNKRVEGNVRLTNGGAKMTLNVVSGSSLTVAAGSATLSLPDDSTGSTSGNLWLENTQSLVVSGGELEIEGLLGLGHKDSGSYPGTLEVTSGTAAVGGIYIVNTSASNMVALSGGTLIIGSKGMYDRHEDADVHVTLSHGTLAGSADWSSDMEMSIGSDGNTLTIDTTKQVKGDAGWGASDDAAGIAITLTGAVTINGTVDVQGSGVLTLGAAVNNGVINVSGTLGVAGAITMGADAQFNMLDGAKIDLSKLTAKDGVYTILTADDLTQSNLDLTGLTAANLTGFSGNMDAVEWTFNADGTISYETLSALKFLGGELTWVDGATGFDGDKTFVQGSSLSFEGDTTATLGEDITVDAMKVTSGTTLTLNDGVVDEAAAGYSLTANSLSNAGTIIANAAINATSLTNTGTLVAYAGITVSELESSGWVEVSEDSVIGTYSSSSTGTLAVATGKTLTVGSADTAMDAATFKTLLAAGISARAGQGFEGTISVQAQLTDTYWGLTSITGLEGSVDVQAHYDLTSLNCLILSDTSEGATMTTNVNSGGVFEAHKLVLNSGQTINVNSGGTLQVTDTEANAGIYIKNGATISLVDGGSLQVIEMSDDSGSQGGVFNMTGGTLSVLNSVTNYSGSFSMTGGTLVTADDNGWSMNGPVTLGAVTVAASNAAAITLNGAITFAATVVNNGILAIGSGATLTLQDGDLSKLTAIAAGGGRTEGNGFDQTTYVLVDGSGAASSLTLAGDMTVAVGDASYAVTAVDGSLTFAMAGEGGGIYYVNEGTVIYGGDNSDLVISQASGIVINNGNLTLASSLDAATSAGITVNADTTILLAADSVTLNATDIRNSSGHAVTLTGSGVYSISDASHVSAVSGLTDSAWTGTLSTASTSVTFAGTELGALGNANSKVQLTGAVGYFNSGTLASELVLKNSNIAAMEITSLGDADSYSYAFTGSVTSDGGSGNFLRADDTDKSVNLAFSGDISAWSGDLNNKNSNGATNVTFSGAATSVNVALLGNLNVEYAATGTTTVSSASSSYTGTTAITSGTVALASGVSSLGSSATIASGATLQLQGNTLGCAITNAGTLQVSGASSITSLAGGALELGSSLSVADALSSITSITVASELSTTTPLVSARTISFADAPSVNLNASLLDAVNEGVYTLVAATDGVTAPANLKLSVEGADEVDGTIMVGTMSYTLEVLENSIVLKGTFNGFNYEGTDGENWLNGDASNFNGGAASPGEDDVVGFSGDAKTVVIDGSNGTISVRAIRVDSLGAYTFTGDDEGDQVSTKELLVLAGGLALDGADMGVEGSTTVGGAGTTATMTVAEGTTFTTGSMVVKEGSSFENEGDTTIAGSFTVADATSSFTNEGSFNAGSDSTFGNVANNGIFEAGSNASFGTVQNLNGSFNAGSDSTFGDVANQGTFIAGDGSTFASVENNGSYTTGAQSTITGQLVNKNSFSAGSDSTFGEVVNDGTFQIGGGSAIGSLENNGTFTVTGEGTATSIDKLTKFGTVELAAGTHVTVANFAANGIDTLRMGAGASFETSSTGPLWIDNFSGASSSSLNAGAADVVFAASTHAGNVAANSVDVTNAAGSTFTGLTTNALTLNVNGLKDIGGGALLTLDAASAAAPGGTIELTLTGIGMTRSIDLLDTAAFTYDNAAGLGTLYAADAENGVNQYTSYTLVSIQGGTTSADVWSFSEAQQAALQNHFALAGAYAVLEYAANGDVLLNVYQDDPRTWNGGDFTDSNSDDKWAGNVNNNGGHVLDLSQFNTYSALDHVDIINISKDTVIDLTKDDLSNAADVKKGIVLTDVNGTGSVTLLGDGTGAYGYDSIDELDRATFINSQDTTIGNLTVDNVYVMVESTTAGAGLTTGDVSLLNDAVVEVTESGKLTMGNVELSGENAWIDNYGTVSAGDVKLSGAYSEIDNAGTMSLGNVELSGEAAWLINAEGSMTTGNVVLTGDDSLVGNNGTMVVNGLAGLAGDNAMLVNVDGSLTVSDYVALNGENAKLVNKGTMEADALSLNGANSVAYNSGKLTVGDVWISGADAILVSAAEASTSVASIDGTEGMGMLSGVINVIGGTDTVGDYSGRYGASAELADKWGYATEVTLKLGSGAKQNLTIGGESGSKNLAIEATGATTTLTYTAGDASLKSLHATNANITLDNYGASGVNTLTLGEGSVMTGGSLSFSVSASQIASGRADEVVSGLNISGTTIYVSQGDDAGALAFDVANGVTSWTLFTLTNGTTNNVTVVLDPESSFLNRYFENATVVNGVVKADIVTDYYAKQFDVGTEGDGNAAAGIRMLDWAALQLAPTTGDLADVLKSLDGFVGTDKTAAQNLAAAFAGSGVASLGMALSGDVERQLKAIRNRTTTMGVDPAVVNENMPYFNAWINAEGDHRELDQDGTLAGYTLDSWGGTVGFDMDVNPSLTWGLAVTAMYGDFSAESTDMVEGDVDTYYVSAFARTMSGAWVHTFVATVGMSSSELSRTVTHSSGSYTTEGEADGTSFGLLYEVARTFALNEDATACWQPVVNVAYRHVEVDGYDETGSDAALRIGDQSMDTVTFGIGGRFQAVVGESIYNRTSIFEARALVKFEAGDRESEMDTALLSAPVANGKVKSAEMDAVGIEVGAGLTVPLGMDAGSIFMDASVDFSGSYINANGTLGYRINF